jgi:hypothetical protein
LADNVAITAGTGTTIAADDIGGGVLVQRVKATWGPDGTANDTDVASGKSMPVQIRGSGGTEVVIVDDAAFTPATTPVLMVGFFADEASTDSVTEGDGGAARMTLDRKVIVTPQPHTAGGLSVFRSLDLDESEEDVKTSAGCLYKLRIANLAATTRYVKLYNDTAANVVVGSATPIDTIVVPAAAVLTENFGGLGLTFDTALSMAATTALADADTGAPSANDVVVSAYYK